jgi:heme exporter protein B
MGEWSSTWSSLLAVIRKDFMDEFRTRHALTSLLMFSVVTLSVVSFSVGAYVPDSAVHAALLWVIIFFTAMSGLGRSFIKEEEKQTAVLLRLAASSDVVFLGKLCFNSVIMLLVSGLVFLLYIVLMNVGGNLWLLGLIILGGTLGMAAASTILAAIVARSTNQGVLLPVLSLPMLMPLLMVSIAASRAALDGAAPAEVRGLLMFLLSYVVVVSTASFLLFDYVWSV